MNKQKRGFKQCEVCGGVLHEHVGEDSLDYWKCSICGHKVRIFHKRAKPAHKPVDLNDRFSDPEDYPKGHI